MCEKCLSVSAAYFLLVTIVFTNAFNLNWNYAPVFHDESAGSYFGYSIAFRKFESQYRLLIGAPKGTPKSSDLDFFKQKDIEEPGVVFQCNLTRGWGCSLLKIDTTGNKKEESRYLHHKKDRSMFGGALAVSDDEIRTVVCAPKWKNAYYKNHYLLNGICYWNDVPNDDQRTKYLMPLISRDKVSFKRKDTNEQIFNYAYGEAGFTVHFPKNSSDLILGAPGIFDWKGSIIKYKGDKFEYGRPIVSYPSDDVYKKAEVPSPIEIDNDVLGSNNYLGYAIDSGKFFRSDVKTSYVSSAPRGEFYRGKVFIFDFPDNDGDKIIIRITLKGKQMGEYFGASVCVADINGDGLDDLIVGAPQYSLSSLNAAQTIGDEGCIYVYINEDFGNMREVTGDNRIMGRSRSGARFGTAVANVGDLNYDGAEDIAVGAPYEDNGVIYIYHGRKSGSPLQEVQIIQAKDINPFIRGLGISFSKGLDIDGNHYKDIAAGAYESGHAVVLRSHPIVTFTSTLTPSVKRISNKTNSFTLRACLQYYAKYPPKTVDVQIGLKVDTAHNRALIEGSSEPIRNFKESLRVNENTCKTLEIKLKGENKDASKPLEIVMEYDLTENPANQKPILNSNPDQFCKDCPVIDINQSKSHMIKVPFETGCKTEVCKPDLEVRAKFTGVTDKLILGAQQTLEMLVEVVNKGEPAFLPQVTIFLPTHTPLIRYPQNCQNVPDANRPKQIVLNCELGNSLSGNKTIKLQMDLKDVPTEITQLIYEINATSSGEEATPDDNHRSVRLDVDVLVDLTITGVSSREQILYVSQNNTILKDVNVTHTFEVSNIGPSRVDKAIIVIDIPYNYYINGEAKGIIGIHKETVTLQNSGNNEVLICELNSRFSYYQRSNNTHNYEPVSIGGGKIEPQEVFSTNYNDSSTASFRRKRSTDSKQDKCVRITPQTPENKTLFINCANPLVEWATIICKGGPFYANKSRAVIHIPLTLHNIESLEKDLESKDIILLSTRGRVSSEIPTNPKQPEGHRPDEVIVQTIFLGKVNVSDGGIPTWIIAVAIICGLLILCLIAMALHKMGFFKREKKDELEALKEAEAEGSGEE